MHTTFFFYFYDGRYAIDARVRTRTPDAKHWVRVRDELVVCRMARTSFGGGSGSSNSIIVVVEGRCSGNAEQTAKHAYNGRNDGAPSLSLALSLISLPHSLSLSLSIDCPEGVRDGRGWGQANSAPPSSTVFRYFHSQKGRFRLRAKGRLNRFYLFYTVCHMFKNPDEGDGVELRIRRKVLNHTGDFGFSPKEGQYLLTRLNLITKLDIYIYI